MITINLSDRDDAELIKDYASHAQRLGDAVVNWLPANRMARKLLEIERILRARGQQSRLKLAPLLEHNNRFVRYYVAKELIGLIPMQSRNILEENAKEFDAIAGDARGFLRSLDTGRYEPD